MPAFKMEKIPIMLDGSDAVRIDILIFLFVLSDGVVRPTAFPKPSGLSVKSSRAARTAGRLTCKVHASTHLPAHISHRVQSDCPTQLP